jgi:two-component system, OmpR family, response regulator TrcR
MSNVLIVEDDQAMAVALSDGFQYEGYSVTVARDGANGLTLATEKEFDIVILDVMLPKMSGFDVCRELRSAGNRIPVIMLTARGQEIDKVLGLKIGADDYMTKPFSLDELVARLRGLLRRIGETTPLDDETLRVGDLLLDGASREVRRGGDPIELTATEFELLRYLMRNPRRALSREEILQRVWNYAFGGKTSIVDLYISYLRKKIDAGREPMICTIRGVGYQLRPTQ